MVTYVLVVPSPIPGVGHRRYSPVDRVQDVFSQLSIWKHSRRINGLSRDGWWIEEVETVVSRTVWLTSADHEDYEEAE